MNGLSALVRRNCKLFFKDKGLFFTSLITPLILLVLYLTFLANVFKDTFVGILGDFKVEDKLLNGLVGGQLVSSILAVSCVTVAFCSNMLMVQDKISGARRDLTMTTVNKSTLALSYYIATFISTLIVCLSAMALCFIYLAVVGWYLSFLDVVLVIFDVILLVLFGTALSSIINLFLNSQGQISAVGTIVSSGYGFISGAYMPLYSFNEGLRNVLMFLPGTYGSSLVKNHCMNGAFKALEDSGIPKEMIKGIMDGVDCNLYFFKNQVPVGVMLTVLGISVIILIGVYVLLNVLRRNNK